MRASHKIYLFRTTSQKWCRMNICTFNQSKTTLLLNLSIFCLLLQSPLSILSPFMEPYYPKYDEFISRANTIQVGKEWFKNNINKLNHPTKVPNYPSLFLSDIFLFYELYLHSLFFAYSLLQILSIGCGSGDIDLQIIELLAPQTCKY
jgi:hypothetical protein